MKVAVLGSWRQSTIEHGWELLNQEYFQPACVRLGEELARQGHQLIVAQTARDTADKFVHQGFTSVSGVKKHYKTIVQVVQNTKVWVKAHLGAVEMADAVIVLGGADGTYTAGQAAMLSRKRLLPVPIFGGAAAALSGDFEKRIDRQLVTELGSISPNSDSNWLDTMIHELMGALQDFPLILIIHGRANDKLKLKEALINGRGPLAGLPEPIIMSERARAGESIPELFEELAATADAAIAVVTAEDIGAPAVNSNGTSILAIDVKQLYPRARQNVWVEVGWFWGRLGRDRIMLLHRGDTDIPSDLGSIIRQEYKDDPSERIDELGKFVDGLKQRR